MNKYLITQLSATACAASLLLAVSPTADAAVIAGDVIVIDFGKTSQETAGNWNNIAENTPPGVVFSSGTLDADLNRFSDNAGTGVSLSVSTSASQSGIGGLVATAGSVSFGSSGAIPNSAQVDVAYIQNDAVTFTFGGLDNSLTYNVEILALVDSGNARDSADFTIAGVTKTIDPNDGAVTAFNNLSATAGGQIVISFSGTSTAPGDAAHINAIELTAVPEPGSLALLGLGGLCMLRRRRA